MQEDIIRKILIKHNFSEDIEALLIEIDFWKYKWLLCGLYQALSWSDQYFLGNLNKA